MQEAKSNNSSPLENYTDSGFSTWRNITRDSYNQGFSRTPTLSAEKFIGVKDSKYRFDFVIFRGSHRKYFIKKLLLTGLLKNLSIFTGKHLCWSLFLIKLRAFKNRLQHRCFPVTIAKFLRRTVLKNICERLLLHIL